MLPRRDTLEKSVQFIKGVGPRKAKILNKLGILSVNDLLYHFPYRYEDRRNLAKINGLKIGQIQTIHVRIVSSGLHYTRKGPVIFEAAAADETGNITLVWFNQPYLKDKIKAGEEIILYGKIDVKSGHLQIVNPEYEIITDENGCTSIHTARIVPIYPLTAYLKQRSLRTIINTVINLYAPDFFEFLPLNLRHRLNLIHIADALKNIHFPENETLLEKAKGRLIFDEFFMLELISAVRKNRIKNGLAGIQHKENPLVDKIFFDIVPFKLTPSQSRVIEEIKSDMLSPKPMYRIIQGDVGSGKTIVAVYAMLLSVLNGYQSALMVPTEILAEQHYALLKKMFSKYPLKVVLLKGGLTNKEKEKIYRQIEKEKADIVIGTHALIQEGIKFKRLGLSVIDEQHKFGVLQRKTLKEKGINPDVLVMTATPIPRTLTMILYSDMDLSIISELPPGRKPVTTWWVSGKKRIDAYNFIKREILGEKKQAYIVYPIIEQSEKLDLLDAVRMYEYLKEDVFKNFKVGLIHGRMKGKEKDLIMQSFKNRDMDILVSTIVIEVGIDIPSASIILIEHAERFGLAQLHQLRGRVGRGEFKSYCILVSDAGGKDALRRMNAMIKCNDGFEIAEKDLKIRGPGEIFGIKQHGFPEFKIADPVRDIEILKIAKKEAFNLVEQDSLLQHPENSLLHEEIRLKFKMGLD